MKSTRERLTAAAATGLMFAGAARAAAPPLYSFETLYNSTGLPDPAGTRPDDFHPNGGGTTITQDAIGATDQSHSLKFTMVPLATFTGAETELLPDHLSDDNAAITMDVTIPSTGNFTGTFANLGVSEFGTNPTFGSNQVQCIAEAEASIPLQPGTYHIGVPLIARTNPITFDSNVSFHSIFGPDPNTQLTPADWEFFVNKSNDAALTIYVDNIRTIQMLPGDVSLDGTVNALDFNRIATNFGTTLPQYTKGDLNLDGQIDAGDYVILAQNFGQSAPPAATVAAVVPEPSVMACLAIGAVAGTRRRSSWRGKSGCEA
jgi:hypothetical protein